MPAMQAEKARVSVENSALAARLRREITGDVLFDRFNRGLARAPARASGMLPRFPAHRALDFSRAAS